MALRLAQAARDLDIAQSVLRRWMRELTQIGLMTLLSVQTSGRIRYKSAARGEVMKEGQSLGGVDTHKDLHVAAVADHKDRLLGVESFPTTRHGWKLMLAWMRSFGELQRIGVECPGSYGAGLLPSLQTASPEIPEVT